MGGQCRVGVVDGRGCRGVEPRALGGALGGFEEVTTVVERGEALFTVGGALFGGYVLCIGDDNGLGVAVDRGSGRHLRALFGGRDVGRGVGVGDVEWGVEDERRGRESVWDS